MNSEQNPIQINKLKSSNYIKTLLFCDNTLSKEIKESYRINGISHLFSVSGMHINFFVSIIYLYLNKITYNKRIKYLITNIFIITYLILFPSSSLLRSAVMSILYSINYLFFNKRVEKLEFKNECQNMKKYRWVNKRRRQVQSWKKICRSEATKLFFRPGSAERRLIAVEILIFKVLWKLTFIMIYWDYADYIVNLWLCLRNF